MYKPKQPSSTIIAFSFKSYSYTVNLNINRQQNRPFNIHLALDFLKSTSDFEDQVAVLLGWKGKLII